MAAFCIWLWLCVIGVDDLRRHRISGSLTLPGAVATAGSACMSPSVVVAVLVAVAPYLLGFWWRQVGGGDVKLAVIAGAMAADWRSAAVVVCLASLFALVSALSAPRAHVSGRPHAPALVAAMVVVLAAGDPMWM